MLVNESGGARDPGTSPAAERAAQMTAIVEALPAPVVVVTRDETVRAANAAFRRLVAGDTPLIDERLEHVLPPLADAGGLSRLRATLEDGESRTARLVLEGRIFDAIATRVPGPEALLCLTFQDVGEYTHLRRDFERVLASIGEALLIVDTRWRVTYWNPAAERISGVSRRAVVGRVLWDRIWGLRGSDVEPMLRESMERRVPLELRTWRYGGDRAGRAAGIYDARSYPIEGGGLLILFQEVSERVHIERELAARAEESEALRDMARALVAEPDRERVLSTLCAAAMTQTGSEGASVVQVNGDTGHIVASAGVSSMPLGLRYPLEGSMAQQVIASRTILSEADYIARFPQTARAIGLRGLGPMLMAPLVAHDEVLGVLATARRAGGREFDAREAQRLGALADFASFVLWKARLLEAAQMANAAKSMFLQTISHELRTPIAALTGYEELLADEIVGTLSDDQRDIVDRMCTVTHHLSVMIEEILAFADLEAGREEVHASEISPAALLQEAATVIEPLARHKDLPLAVSAPAAPRRFVTDADKARQILVNLASNAVKFTDRGEVRLEVVPGEAEVAFRVTDTGIGIPEPARERIFEPFFQADGGLTRRYGGAGLGLYISGRLAALLGGRIEFETAEGRGSRFTLVLPWERRD